MNTLGEMTMQNQFWLGSYRCAYCKSLHHSTPNFTIHRDGYGVGPEVPLCDGCGSGQHISCAQIWKAIGEPVKVEPNRSLN